MSNDKISEQKINEAKEKLACHIQPPKPKSSPETKAVSCAGTPIREADFIDENGKVLLTRMTSAGG
jgi:hypothetical protein